MIPPQGQRRDRPATALGRWGPLPPWWRPLLWSASLLLQLGTAAALGQGAGELGGVLEGFGRWERNLHHCRITGVSGSTVAPLSRGAASDMDCGRLRLEQQLPGLLSMRFVTATGRGGYGSSTLVFAGVLERNSAPMQCLEGHCELRGPLQLQVTAVAMAGFDARGLAGGLPRAILAKGRCSLQLREVRCNAAAADGERWSAVADL